MCGIAGILDTNPQARAEPQRVRRMLKSIEHRGPGRRGLA